MRRWLVIGGLVLVALLIAVVPRLGGDEPHRPRRGHPEAGAAAVALVYARGVQVDDMDIACGVMTLDAARAVGCGTANARPQACGDFSIPGTLIHRFDASHATVEVGRCRIELVPGAETRWAVARVLAR
jgi:hypothetical protein